MDATKTFSDLMLRLLMYDHIAVIAMFGAMSILYFNRHAFSEEKYNEYMVYCIVGVIISSIIILVVKKTPGLFIL